MNVLCRSVMMIVFVLGLMGCATNKVDWNARVGNYTHDQAVLEMGPPDKSADLQDGTRVSEWLLQRGAARGYTVSRHGYWVDSYSLPPAPDWVLRLTFNPQGKLTEWKRFYK